jgi:hypothetical protein
LGGWEVEGWKLEVGRLESLKVGKFKG